MIGDKCIGEGAEEMVSSMMSAPKMVLRAKLAPWSGLEKRHRKIGLKYGAKECPGSMAAENGDQVTFRCRIPQRSGLALRAMRAAR